MTKNWNFDRTSNFWQNIQILTINSNFDINQTFDRKSKFWQKILAFAVITLGITLGDRKGNPPCIISAARRLNRSQSRRHIVIFASMILNSFIGLSGAMTCAGIERFTVECNNKTLNFQDFNGTPAVYTDTICETPQVWPRFSFDISLTKFWQKIQILAENQNFDNKSKFWQKIENVTKNRDFGKQKMFCKEIEIWTENRKFVKKSIFYRKSKFWQKIEILT